MFKSLCFALLILAGTSSAFAECSRSIFYQSPSVPDARNADISEMSQAAKTIQSYILAAEKALSSCREIDSISFNYYVGRLKSLAADINKQSAIFQALGNS